MEILPRNTTCLDLSIAMPGFSSSPPFPSSVARGETRIWAELGPKSKKLPRQKSTWAKAKINLSRKPFDGKFLNNPVQKFLPEARGPNSVPSPLTGARDVVAAKGGAAIKLLDINEAPSRSEEECMEVEDDDENPNRFGPTHRKKLRLTKEQSRRLEENFLQNPTLNIKEKEVLAMELRLKPRQVEVWFQNRRARSKMKQTEIECEYLKRWFEALTEQNRRLQKEVEELRLMKAAPPLQPPVSALTMCPRCERITNSITTTTISSSSSVDKVRFPHRRRA